MQNPGDACRVHRPRLALNKSVEALFDSENVPAEACRCLNSSANHRIQCRAVPAARQDSYTHRRSIKRCRERRGSVQTTYAKVSFERRGMSLQTKPSPPFQGGEGVVSKVAK